jgi:MoaA/NifB/PqqE/SkfB family radical SAM enzyme/GT2 family glycosyltransferase
MRPARTPRILWVELTSKCPFDCVFCSRKTRRGAGEHMPYALFERLVMQVKDPRKFLLNYSGESTVYPDLISAIRLARSTGAAVELVTALAAAGDTLVDELARSGVTRLTVSIHATDEARFAEIYRYGSFAALRAKLARFVSIATRVENPPAVDLAFVAMQRNLDDLDGVADLAQEMGLRSISIFPVIRRDQIPVFFPELDATGDATLLFRDAIARTIERVRSRQPEIDLAVCNPRFTMNDAPLGEAPSPWPGALPAGAAIHSCEQNPWETAHVLANGDVVACEVHDRQPLGNLARQSLADVWDGEAYRRFRAAYRDGSLAECRTCPWKTAWLPGPLRSEILGARGRSAQMEYGWHEPEGGSHLWASQQAILTLQRRHESSVLHINGLLPSVPDGRNRLEVWCDGALAGEVVNQGQEMLSFGVDMTLPAGKPGPSEIEFRTDYVYRPVRDQRDLGFALVIATFHPVVDRARAVRQRAALEPLVRAIELADRVGNAVRGRFRRKRADGYLLRFSAGLTVVIPERDNPAELSECLSGLEDARRKWPEPLQTIVVVNGTDPSRYMRLRELQPTVEWRFEPQPLGFTGAVREGLRYARYDWIYLLNSDATPEPDALVEAARLRAPFTFSIASQIFLKDTTRYRDETNWTRLFVEDGLATAHDMIPTRRDAVEHFYAGGGASLFRARLLRQMLRSAIYDPFYWEDVEWGWRARKLGYRSMFCAASVVRHRQGATISRCYSAAKIEGVLERNRLLFQLRNFTTAGSLEAAIAAIARSPGEIAEFFTAPRTLSAIVRGRLWNHLAPVPDEEVLKVQVTPQ